MYLNDRWRRDQPLEGTGIAMKIANFQERSVYSEFEVEDWHRLIFESIEVKYYVGTDSDHRLIRSHRRWLCAGASMASLSEGSFLAVFHHECSDARRARLFVNVDREEEWSTGQLTDVHVLRRSKRRRYSPSEALATPAPFGE